MTTIKITLIASLAAAVLGLATGWKVNGWRLQSQIDGMVAKHTEALANANADALAKYAAMERRKQEALDESNKLAQRNAAAARAAGLERDRLRDQVAAATARLSTSTCPSVRDYSATLSFVLGECAAEIEGLAKTTDGHALDVRTLINAWPR